MQAPTAVDLLNELVVQQALQQAWNDSLPGDPVQRHEEGGWIYMDNTTGAPGSCGGSNDLGFDYAASRTGSRGGRYVPHPSKPECRGVGTGS